MKKNPRSEHRLVSYDGDGEANFYRRVSGTRPTDAEGKPLKVLDRRKGSPRENAEIARVQHQYRARQVKAKWGDTVPSMMQEMVERLPKRWG